MILLKFTWDGLCNDLGSSPNLKAVTLETTNKY